MDPRKTPQESRPRGCPAETTPNDRHIPRRANGLPDLPPHHSPRGHQVPTIPLLDHADADAIVFGHARGQTTGWISGNTRQLRHGACLHLCRVTAQKTIQHPGSNRHIFYAPAPVLAFPSRNGGAPPRTTTALAAGVPGFARCPFEHPAPRDSPRIIRVAASSLPQHLHHPRYSTVGGEDRHAQGRGWRIVFPRTQADGLPHSRCPRHGPLVPQAKPQVLGSVGAPSARCSHDNESKVYSR